MGTEDLFPLVKHKSLEARLVLIKFRVILSFPWSYPILILTLLLSCIFYNYLNSEVSFQLTLISLNSPTKLVWKHFRMRAVLKSSKARSFCMISVASLVSIVLALLLGNAFHPCELVLVCVHMHTCIHQAECY